MNQGFVWGVDVGVRLVAFSHIAPDGHGDAHSCDLRGDAGDVRGASRLALAHALLCRYTTEMAQRYPPACVCIEQPMGHAREPALDHMTGVVQAAIYLTLGALYYEPCPVWTLNIGQWKKAAIGNGAAKKDDIMAWARERYAYQGDSQDEADSLAIGFAGAVLTGMAASPT